MDAVKNFVKVGVSTGYGASDTSINLSPGQGAKLPTPPVNLVWWNATDYADPADDPNVEIVRVTSVAGDTLTVMRAQENTAATVKNFAGRNYLMVLAPTAKIFTDIFGTPVSLTYPAPSGDGLYEYVTTPASGGFGPMGMWFGKVTYTQGGVSSPDDTMGFGFNYNFGRNPVASYGGCIGIQFESDYWNNAVHAMECSLNYQSPPITTATFGGTVTNGDTMKLTATQSGMPGSPVTKTITAGPSDTLNTLATAMAAAINADATLKLYFRATAQANVVRIANIVPAAVGTVWSRTNGATETIAVGTTSFSSRPFALGLDRDNGPDGIGAQYWLFGIGDQSVSGGTGIFAIQNSQLNNNLFTVIGSATAYSAQIKHFGYTYLATTDWDFLDLDQKGTNDSYVRFLRNGTAQWNILCRTGGGSPSGNLEFYSTGASSALILGKTDYKASFAGQVALSAATTSRASLNLPSGVAPTSPQNGDIWSDGTNVYVRLGGVTHTLNMT